MTFHVEKAAERADIIAYLRENSGKSTATAAISSIRWGPKDCRQGRETSRRWADRLWLVKKCKQQLRYRTRCV